MSPVQTAYSANIEPAIEGMRADLSAVFDVISANAEGSDIGFGRAVVRGTSFDQAVLPSAPGQELLGITQRTTAWSVNENDEHLYQQYREMNIVNFGRIWVYTETAVNVDDKVFFRFSSETAPLDVIGRFRSDSSGGNAQQIAGAAFKSVAEAGELAIVQLRGTDIVPDAYDAFTATTGAVPLYSGATLFDTTAGAAAVTLADGFEGQLKTLSMLVDNGDAVVTPANFVDGTTITLNDVGDFVNLIFVDGSWKVLINSGAIVA